MKYVFFLCLLLIPAGPSISQIVTVVDKQTQKPVESVVITSREPHESTLTNTDGQADVSVFSGAEEIQIRHLGYITQFRSYLQLQDSHYKIELEQSSMNLNQVVVSASRWQQAFSNVPSTISVITPEVEALENPQTAADLLELSGKVFIQKSQQGGGSPMIRGFATNRLVYTVDGVRMNTAIFRGGNIQNVINLDPFATEKNEVLFGPGSVIYGSDAIGGVMTFLTLTPRLSITSEPVVTGKAVTRYSSANNEKTAHLDVNLGWKKWALVTSISTWNFDHLRQGSKGPDDYIKNLYVQRQDSTDVVITQDDPLLQIPSAYSQVNLMQKVRFQPSGNWDFQYGFHYSTTSAYGRYDRHNRFRNGTLRYAEWNYGPQLWMMHNLAATHKGNNLFYEEICLRIAQQSFEESRIDRSLNNDDRTTQTEKVKAYSANLDLVKALGPKNTLYYGVEYILDDVSSAGILCDIRTGSETAGPSRYPQSTWSSMAAYLNDAYRISDQFSLQAGLRYNRFHLEADFTDNLEFYPFPFASAEIDKGALTGSLGGVWRPSDSWIIKTNFGTAFRAPNVDDIGKVFDSEPGAVTVPNPDLEAEYAYNFDLGITKVFGEILKMDVAAYYTKLQNALVRRDFQLNGQDSILYGGTMSKVQAIQNAALANVYGIHAGIEIRLTRDFTLLSDLNYQKGTEELEDGTVSPSRHASPLFGISRLRYQHRNLTLELNTNYQGERSFEDLPAEEQAKDEIYAKDENGNNYSPAWYTLNFMALYKLNDTFSISCGVENLTDQRYRPYGSGISGAGRNVVLSLRAQF
ncbi:MAG: TonB-dependent receptor [Bacteroidales bacterium]|nr:TonB-dependent receptor [Bacteroidales bacterium]